MTRSASILLLGLSALALSACGKGDTKTEVAKLDDSLLGKGTDTDPAITSALEDQIMVDPALVGQSNAHSAKPADLPTQAPIPATNAGGPPAPATQTLGQRVAQAAPAVAQAAPAAPRPAAASQPSVAPAAAPMASGSASISEASFAGCGMEVSYSLAWSARLPSDLPLYPQSRVAEAAGSDVGGCRLRAVTFASNAATRSLIDFYLNAGRKAGYQTGYSTKKGEQMVTGSRGDGAAFYVVLTPQGSGGTMADIVANRGV